MNHQNQGLRSSYVLNDESPDLESNSSGERLNDTASSIAAEAKSQVHNTLRAMTRMATEGSHVFNLGLSLLRKDFRTPVIDLLRKADIEVNGNRPWDIQVHNEDLFREIVLGGSVAAGETYMAKWWDCEDLNQFFHRILRVGMEDRLISVNSLVQFARSAMTNLQSQRRALFSVSSHYDLGNDLYRSMLDPEMIYTCAYWKDATTLEEAQEAKLKLICEKIGLRPGMRVLDIGCGWGGFLRYAVKNYGVSGVGITLSADQVSLGRELCAGLDIEIRREDYRAHTGQYDRIVSIGMFEHVGYRNYQVYLESAARCLKPDGLFLLHTIGSNRTDKIPDPWIDKHIFPDGILPSIQQIGAAMEGLFVMEDWHNFGHDYNKTLLAWFENFDRNYGSLAHSPSARQYDETFYRKWKYYLLLCAGSFSARKNQLWQLVLSPSGVPGGYRSIR